ncbi:MAG: response regulator [Sphingobacteriales bacterium]|nr:response regulator [Sphingobacteriales bacterium]
MDKSIFIIDDYSINLLIAKLTIKQHGFFEKITTYSEAQLALDYVINNQNNHAILPDVILLDLNMPVMDGWEFLDALEELASKLVNEVDIYILSSSLDLRDIQRSKKYVSVNGFLSKPLTTEMLENIMKTSLKTAG